MEVANRRSGVPAWTIPRGPSFYPCLGHFKQALLKQKVRSRPVADIPCLEKGDGTPLKKESEGNDRVSDGRVTDRSAFARRYSRYQRTRAPPRQET